MTDSISQIVQQYIFQRQSVGQLVEPAPNQQQLELALQAALTAPDHHRLKPTKFIVIPTRQREAFGQLLAQAMQDLGEDATQIERVKQHPLRAPMLIVVVTQLQDHPKVPHFEQILSTGAAIENLLLSLQVQGFASMWRSGKVVESNYLKQALGFQAQDIISGMIYVGTAAKLIPARAEVSCNDAVQFWQGSLDTE